MEKFERYLNLEIEQKILVRFLSKNDEINNYPDLKPEHFIYKENRTIFERMLIANENGKPFVARTLCNKQEEKDYLNSLFSISSFKKVDKEVALLIEESDKYNALIKVEELLKEAEENDVDVFSTLSDIATRDIMEKVDDSPEAMLRALEDKMKNGDSIGIKTGINDLDYNINNLQKGRLYIVGARSGMGKSALMCSFAEYMEKSHKVGIISLEMKSTELKQRIACIRGKIPHWKIEKGRCQDEFDKYAESLISVQNIIIDDRGGLNRSQVLAKVKQLVKKAKCEVVFIDHLGLIQVDSKGNLAHEIGKITALLKSVAKELDIPVVCLCQINRSSEKDAEKRPKMSDLRDSGRIEEDADCIILLYRDGYYEKQPKAIEPCEYIVAKCRNGKRGVVDGCFTGELMKFE